MVMKISVWSHKISSKAMAMGQYTPDMFVKSQWQRSAGISVFYLVYRWLMAGILLGILVASIMEVGRSPERTEHYTKWPIYLTHWGFTLCTLQALLAAYLVTWARFKQPEKEAEAMKMNHTLRIYWVLHSCATVGAFSISAIYWSVVYNPAENPLDAINLLVHVGNSVLMLTDLIIVAHPIRIVDFYWPICFSVSYATFSYIYFISGGTARKGRVYIYKILNWEEPRRSLIVIQLCIVFVFIVHMSVCMLSVLRCKLAELIRRRQAVITDSRARNLQGATNEIPINDLV